MTQRTKIYIGIAAVVLVVICGTAFWQSHRIAVLENSVSEARQAAEEKREFAGAKEIEAAAYKQKIEYLEAQLLDIKTRTRRQDEKLEKLNVNSRDARTDVERAKRTRAIDTNSAELCAKLAELGHPC